MNPSDKIRDYLQSEYGTLANILIKDDTAPSGIRPWQQNDSSNLTKWLTAQNPETTEHPPANRICHNLSQAAELTGVGVHTIQHWVSRDTNPLPHIRHNHRFIIPHFMLLSWLRDESLRTITAQSPITAPNGKYNAGAPDTEDAGRGTTTR